MALGVSFNLRQISGLLAQCVKVMSKPVGLCVSTHDSNAYRFLDGARTQNARRVLGPHDRAWLAEFIGTWAAHMACRNGAMALITVHVTWD